MSPAGMIVVDVSAQDSPEVSLVEDDHVIETLVPSIYSSARTKLD